MSTSCNLALDLKPKPDVQPFAYPDVTGNRDHSTLDSGTGTGEDALDAVAITTRENAAREQGRREGEAAAGTSFASQLAQVRDSLQVALSEFALERAAYYQRVEAEVVQLALSIARKILHRESQIDPHLLAGLVRVALERIESGTKVMVRVNPHQVSEFRGYFAHHLEPRDVPEVLEDPAVEMDGCVLQTALGNADLGVEVQLKEVEQGLFDLVAQRPKANP